jgi:hypothetical protein
MTAAQRMAEMQKKLQIREYWENMTLRTAEICDLCYENYHKGMRQSRFRNIFGF